MPAPFPHHYAAVVARTDRAQAAIEAPPRAPLLGGPPPEFDGDPTRWSPEHLLLSAIGLCLFTTFEALAARASLAVIHWRAEVSGIVDKTSSGLAFTSYQIAIDLEVECADDVDRARELLDKAKKHCLISNALRAPVELAARVSGAAAAA